MIRVCQTHPYTARSMDRGFQKPEPNTSIKIRRGRIMWYRLSPVFIFRAFRDNYIKMCMTAGDNASVRGAAHTSAAFQGCEADILSRSSSRHDEDVLSNREFTEVAGKLSHQTSVKTSGLQPVQPSQNQPPLITGLQQGLTTAELQGFSTMRHVGSRPSIDANRPSTDFRRSSIDLRRPSMDVFRTSIDSRSRPSFDAVPESELYTDTKVSKTALETLFRSSSLHPTDFLQSPSRRVAALELYQFGGASARLPPAGPGHALTRSGSERLRRFPSQRSTPVTINGQNFLKPLSPVVDMSTFREQTNGRRSTDLQRAMSRRRERLAKLMASPGTASDNMFSRSGSKKMDAPNPYREYDTRTPSPTPSIYDIRVPSPTPTV